MKASVLSHKGIFFILFTALLTLSSCFKEEDPRPAGEIKATELIALGENYDNQVFYSLENNRIVSSNSYKIWHLGFGAQPDEFYISLNAAAQMAAYNTGETNWDNVTNLNPNWIAKYDCSRGEKTSNAIEFFEQNIDGIKEFDNPEIYVIDLGTDAEGASLGGLKKLAVTSIENGAYTIQFSNLDGTEFNTFTVQKNATLNEVAFSFENGGEIINVQPDKSTWDVLFTRFTDTVYSIDGAEFLTGYAVTGAYINQNSVEAYQVTDIMYDDFTLEKVEQTRFENDLNVIGHDWKQFEDGGYAINENNIYIIKINEALHFKLRFLNFLNPETGLKGYPEFEYELL